MPDPKVEKFKVLQQFFFFLDAHPPLILGRWLTNLEGHETKDCTGYTNVKVGFVLSDKVQLSKATLNLASDDESVCWLIDDDDQVGMG